MSDFLYYGLDLSWDITQISRYNSRTGEPESVCFSGEQQELLMPAVLCRRAADGGWVSGQEALRLAERGGGELVSGLLRKMLDGGQVQLAGTTWSGEALMEQYLRRLLGICRQCSGTSEIVRMAVTLPAEAEELRKPVGDSLVRLGIPQDRLKFLSHTECFMYYCINMPPELWQNDAALFDCDEEHFRYERLSCSKRKQPLTVLARSEDFTEEYSVHREKEEPGERRAYWFYQLAMRQLHNQPVTVLYVTGSGFADGWAEEALRKLCEGRRVFFGQNLYTKGACYAAKMAAEGTDAGCVLLSGDMIRESIYVKLYHDAKERYVELAHAGEDYRSAGCQCRIILDATQEIEFLVSNVLKKEPVHEVMILENLMKRENKTVMLELSLSYADRETPVVQIRDLGFGREAGTRRIWEQIL